MVAIKRAAAVANSENQEQSQILLEQISELSKKTHTPENDSLSRQNFISRFTNLAKKDEQYTPYPDNLARFAIVVEMQRVAQLENALGIGQTNWNEFVAQENAVFTAFPDGDLRVAVLREKQRVDSLYENLGEIQDDLATLSLKAKTTESQRLEVDRKAAKLKEEQRISAERAKNSNAERLAAEAKKASDERSAAESAKKFNEDRPASRLSIVATASMPDADGDFIINIQTSADTASLKIDDEEQGASKTGIYTIRRVARVGAANTITIRAKDVYGNTDTKTISVARQAVDSRPSFARLNPANIKPQPTRDAVAIIIGIQNYKLIPKAEYANQDAQDFYDYASRALGIKQENIKLLLDDDADVSGILTAFQEWLPLKVRKGKTDVYVFYSGHGLPGADGKSLYFLPVGTNKNLVAKTAISQKEIVDALKSAQPKSVTMFIDSCYSGQIRTGETLLASARPVVLTVQETAYPPDFTVITASASDQIASSSPDLKHGIFSYYLMKGLEGEADENKDGTITIGKLQSYLAERVPRFAMTMSRKQEPQLTGDANRVLVAR